MCTYEHEPFAFRGDERERGIYQGKLGQLVALLDLDLAALEANAAEEEGKDHNAKVAKQQGQRQLERRGNAGNDDHQEVNDAQSLESAVADVEVGLVPSLGQDLGHVPQAQHDHGLGDGTDSDGDVADDVDINTEGDGDEADHIVEAQQDQRSAILGVQTGQGAGIPAVVAGLHQGLGAGGDGAVQGGEQSHPAAADAEEVVQGLGEDRLGHDGHGLAGNLVNRKHAGSDHTDQTIENGDAQSGEQHNAGDIAGGVLRLAAHLGDVLSAIAGVAHEDGSLPQTDGTVGHELGGLEVVAVQLGQTDRSKGRQGDDQHDNCCILDLGERVDTEGVGDEQDSENRQSDDLTAHIGEEGHGIVGEGQSVHTKGNACQKGDHGIGAGPTGAKEGAHHGVVTAAETCYGVQEDLRGTGQDGNDTADDERDANASAGLINTPAGQGHDTGTDDGADTDSHQVPEAKDSLQVLCGRQIFRIV